MKDCELTEVAEFLNTCWREAYAGILDPQFLAAVTTAGRAARVRTRLEAGARGFVARADNAAGSGDVTNARAAGAIAGVTLFGPTHLAEEAPVLAGAGEIHMLYVRSDLIGTGLGHRLLGAAEADLLSQGYGLIGLDVYTANRRAIRFYERHGYRKVGSKADVFDGQTVPLDIMAK